MTDELTTLQGVVQKLPEGRERKKLQERQLLLERERDLLLQRKDLVARAQAIDRRAQESVRLRLESMLRTLEPHTQPLEARLDALLGRIRDAATRRTHLKAERAKAAQSPAGASRDSRLAELNEQLLVAAEETAALQLERETVGQGLALAKELRAVGDRLRDEPAISSRSLRNLWDRRNELAAITGRQVSALESAQTMAERRSASADALGLAKEKLGQIDEEIALLAPHTGLFRSTPGVDRLLAAARRDKDTLTAQLPFLAQQEAALAETATINTQFAELLATESAWLQDRLQQLTRRYLQWLVWPVGVAAGVILLFTLANHLALPRFYKQEMLVSARRVNRYFMVSVLLIVGAGFFFEDLRMVATTLGIVSAALVIALQDVLTSIAGWFAIVISHKLRVGDRVEIDGVKGDVLEIELMRTTLNEIDAGLGLDHPTGRIVVLPNSFIFRHRVHNTTRFHRWVWLRTDITVTFETPLNEAMALLQRILEQETAEAFTEARRETAVVEARYGRGDAVYEPKIYCKIGDSGVEFTLITIADYRAKAATRDRLHWRILAEFARDPRLQFAYPTHRNYTSTVPLPEAHEVPPTPPPAPSRLSAWPGAVN